MVFMTGWRGTRRAPSWLGDERFHRAMQSNLLRKDEAHYRPHFGDVPDDMPYLWGNVPDHRTTLLRSWIKERHLLPGAVAGYARRFSAATPFPHLLLRDLLLPGRIAELEAALDRVAFERKESDLFSLWQSGDLAGSRDAFLRVFIGFLGSDDLRSYLEAIIGTRLAPRAVDCAATRYDDGDHLLCHDDRLEGRKLAYILYLGESFTAKDGGALCLLSSNRDGTPCEVVTRYPPRRNSLAIFLVSPTSHHTVSENVGGKRRVAVSGWFHG